MTRSCRVVFEEIGFTFKKRFTCSCGRRLVRSKRFYQTINPFNRTKEGRVKTGLDILVEVRAEGRAWLKAAEPCTHALRTQIDPGYCACCRGACDPARHSLD